MERGKLVFGSVILSMILILSLSIISAGWFSDLLQKNKITGNAVIEVCSGTNQVPCGYAGSRSTNYNECIDSGHSPYCKWSGNSCVTKSCGEISLASCKYGCSKTFIEQTDNLSKALPEKTETVEVCSGTNQVPCGYAGQTRSTNYNECIDASHSVYCKWVNNSCITKSCGEISLASCKYGCSKIFINRTINNVSKPFPVENITNQTTPVSNFTNVTIPSNITTSTNVSNVTIPANVTVNITVKTNTTTNVLNYSYLFPLINPQPANSSTVNLTSVCIANHCRIYSYTGSSPFVYQNWTYTGNKVIVPGADQKFYYTSVIMPSGKNDSLFALWFVNTEDSEENFVRYVAPNQTNIWIDENLTITVDAIYFAPGYTSILWNYVAFSYHFRKDAPLHHEGYDYVEELPLCSTDTCTVNKSKSVLLTYFYYIHQVSIDYIDPTEVKLDIDTSTTSFISEGSIVDLKDGSYLVIKDINYNAGNVSASNVTFSMKFYETNASGCYSSGRLYSFGSRLSGQYCDIESGNFTSQKMPDTVCGNNFECDSNVCASKVCIDAGLFEKFVSWVNAFLK